MNSKLLNIEWTKDPRVIEDVQRFRFKVFVEEFSITFTDNFHDMDIDDFDQVCDHLVVRETTENSIVGTYRLITPAAAKKIGSMYCDSLFDLSPIHHLRDQIVEIDRSCIDKQFRNGYTILLLWKEIYKFILNSSHQYIMGCSSISLADGGLLASNVHQQLIAMNRFSNKLKIKSKHPIQLSENLAHNDMSIPAILKGYLNVGASICSEPGVDPLFNTVDYLTILKMTDMNSKYVKRFLR
jgi:putative hemolysin